MLFTWQQIRVTPERLREVYDNVVDMSTPRRSFYLMVALSAIIASYGLLANSTAVVIGAMLVAPLMGPIFGVALGLTAGDRGLLRQALFSEILGVALTVGLAALIGLMPLRAGFGSEILARTAPTLYDIVIALASGLAGAYAVVSKRVSPALPGVAVAVALVPPLATCGLCLATARWTWAFGAFLLFVANFLAIEIATAVVFGLAGLTDRAPHVRTMAHFLRRFGLSLAALVIIAGYMTHTLATLISQRALSREAEQVLTQQVSARAGARLSELRLQRVKGQVEVVATVLTPRAFQPDQVAAMQAALQQRVPGPVHLVVRSLLSQDMDSQGPVFVPDEERKQQAEAEEEAEFLRRATEALKTYVATLKGAQVTEVRRPAGKDLAVSAVIQTPVAISPAQVAEAQAQLRQALGVPLRLTVTSVLVRCADAQHFLGSVDQPPLSGETMRLYARLRQAVQNQIALQIPGAQLADLRQQAVQNRLLVRAVVHTPRVFEPDQVRVIQAALRRWVSPEIDLVIRSEVGGETSASGYLPVGEEAA